MMKNILLFTLVLCLLSACSGDSSTEPETDAEFETATDFTINDVDDNPVSLSDFDGQVIVLNFFATWCGPCQTEMPQLDNNIWQVYKDQGVMVLGIDLQEDLGQVKLFAVNNSISFRLAIDPTGDVFRAYAGGDAVENVPYNVVIDKEKNIRYSQTGYSFLYRNNHVVAAGTYFIRLQANNLQQVQKISLIH